MNKEQREILKIKLDVFAAIALVIAAVFGFWQYSDTKTKEFHKPLWETQINTYTDVANLVSRLTNNAGSTTWEKDKNKFYEYYWGEMVLLEDKDVEAAMVNFGKHLYDYENNPNPEQNEIQMLILSQYAHKLTYALRDSINKGIRHQKPSVRLRDDINQ